MKAKLTLRRLLGIAAIGLGLALMMLSLAALVAAGGGTPTVNGLFYGDGDEANYTVLGSAAGGRGTLYFNRTGNTLYLAVVVSNTVNDNVFGDTGDAGDETYVKSAGWSGSGSHHRADALINSDNVELKLQCGANSWTWKHGYVYDADGDENPHEADWLSGHGDADGGGIWPTGLISEASSLQWNLNNAVEHNKWDVTLGGHRSWSDTKVWKSPDDVEWPPSNNNVTNNGYPTYDSTNQWEWAMVYEMSIDVSACGSNGIIISVPSAHNSPSKDGTEDVPICKTGCSLTGSIGNYVWHDVNGNGLQDSGETGIADVTVKLYKSDGTPISTTQTNSSGYYIFNNLEAGNYYVEFVPPDGYEFSPRDQGGDDVDSDADPITGKTITITLASGATDLTWDAGLHLCAIGDRVWSDEDGGGDQDNNLFTGLPEPGFNGVHVYLYGGSTPPATCGQTGYLTMTITISGTSQTPDGWPDGIYIFDMDSLGLGTGTYWVCVNKDTLPSAGLNMHWASTTGGNTQQVTYLAGTDDFSFDFGYVAESNPTAVTLSSFAARSSAGGSAYPLWLGLAGLTVLTAGSLFWAKRRTG